MYKKKLSVIALASLMTLTLPLSAQELPPESETVSDEPAVTSEPLAPVETAPEATGAESTAQARWREREARYAELKQRAKEAGVMLPDEPPWKSAGMAQRPDRSERMQRHQAMMNMTPDERMAAREKHYQEMREQAKQRGVEMPETPPWEARQSAMQEEWAKHQAVIDGMSDEERAACHAMHRRHMGMRHRERPQRYPMQRPERDAGIMGPGYGPGAGYGPGYAPGYGQGYGPGPYGQQNFWDPNR
jgi:hypothetical protein